MRSINRSPKAFVAYAYVTRLSGLMKRGMRRTESLRSKEQNNSDIPSLEKALNGLKKGSFKVYGEYLIHNNLDDYKRKTLMVSHELSLTGAPIVLFRMAEVMIEHGWFALLVSPCDGKLGLHAARHGIPTMVIPNLFESDYILECRRAFNVVVVNTILPYKVIRNLCNTDTRVLWWIHEAGISYTRLYAREMPRRVTENIHVCCVGSYTKRELKKRFHLYKADTLTYYSPDLSGSYNDDQHGTQFIRTGKYDLAKKRTYGLIGTIGASKGQDIMVRSIELLSNRTRQGSRFVFVGATKEKDIKNQICDLENRFSDTVFLLNELDMDDVHNVYREIDFLICASRQDPLPVVVAEALSLSKPVICSDGAGSSEIIKHYDAGFVYKRNDMRRLSELIELTYQLSENEYSRLAVNARKAYEAVFSKNVFKKNLSNVMENYKSWKE